MLKYCLSAFVFLSVSMTAHGLEVADYPTYFNGPQQMRVTMLPLANEPDVLIQIKGVNHPIDQVVFRAEMQDRGRPFEPRNFYHRHADYSVLWGLLQTSSWR